MSSPEPYGMYYQTYCERNSAETNLLDTLADAPANGANAIKRKLQGYVGCEISPFFGCR